MSQTQNVDGKQLRVVAPDYLYDYPSFRRVKLAAVKHQMLRPDLPSYRHMESDSTARKLPDEHCRTTTRCTPRDFSLMNMNIIPPLPRRLNCMDITPVAKSLRKRFYTPLDVQRQGYIWHKYLENPLVQRTLQTRGVNVKEPETARGLGRSDLKFDGVAFRFFRADSRNWKYRPCLASLEDQRQEEMLPIMCSKLQ